MLLFGVGLIYICVSIVLAGMSYRRQGTLSLAARDSLRKIIISEPDLSTLFPVNTSLRGFQQTKTALLSTFSERENLGGSPMQNEEELDQPSLDDSELPTSTQEDISSAEDMSNQSDFKSTTDSLFQESYGILVDAVPSAIIVPLSPDISLSSARFIISSLLPDESAWFTRDYSFSRDQWFCFPPFFTSREPAYQSFLASLQQHYLASYPPFSFIQSFPANPNETPATKKRGALRTPNTKSASLRAATVPSSTHTTSALIAPTPGVFSSRAGGFAIDIPPSRVESPRECNAQASDGNTNSTCCIKRFQTRPRGSKTGIFSCRSRT